MKKWTVLLLSCCLLAGCAAPAAAPETARNTQPPAAVEPAEEEPCRYTVDMAAWSDSAVAEDGVLLAECSYRLPELTARRADGTAAAEPDTAAETFNAQFAAWTLDEEFQELADMAQEEWVWRQENGIDWGHAFFTELTCEAYQTEGLVSVAGNYYSYTGGAHPNTVLLAWNFDLASGAFFGPETLAEDVPAFTQAVQEEIVRQSRDAAAEYGLTAEELYWENYEEIAAGWTSYAVSFDETGMTVAFSPYELAAYAAGPQVFRLSYDQIAPYLSEHGRELLGLEASEN